MHMTTKTTLKIATASLLTLAFTAGAAFAGDGKDCNHKKKTAMKTEATMAQQASVLPAAERRDATTKKTMKMKKAYSFDDALKLCQEKGAADLQACIDYKTGKTAKAKPKS